MTAQIYNKQRINFFTGFMPKDPPYSNEFYLGQFSKWDTLKNDKNEFTSLGGNIESPITYKYQGTGTTNFVFSIVSPIRPDTTGISQGLASYELWIDGIKPYYFFFDSQLTNLYGRTISVVGEKDKITKFKLRMNFHYITARDTIQKFYFEGDPNIIYSSITAQFIPDPILGINNDPIIISEDSQLTLNRQHIIKAPLLKTINLTIDENCKIGDWIELKNLGIGNFQINTGSNTDILMNARITRAKNGYIKSTKRGDFVRLQCMEIEPRIIFSDTNTIGTFTVI